MGSEGPVRCQKIPLTYQVGHALLLRDQSRQVAVLPPALIGLLVRTSTVSQNLQTPAKVEDEAIVSPSLRAEPPSLVYPLLTSVVLLEFAHHGGNFPG